MHNIMNFEGHDRIDSCKFTPVLKNSRAYSGNNSITEKFIFKRAITLEKHKNNVIDNIYLRKSPLPRKPVIMEPIEHKYAMVINSPILGNKHIQPPRSSSVIPQKKYQISKFNKFHNLVIPVLRIIKHTRIREHQDII